MVTFWSETPGRRRREVAAYVATWVWVALWSVIAFRNPQGHQRLRRGGPRAGTGRGRDPRRGRPGRLVPRRAAIGRRWCRGHRAACLRWRRRAVCVRRQRVRRPHHPRRPGPGAARPRRRDHPVAKPLSALAGGSSRRAPIGDDRDPATAEGGHARVDRSAPCQSRPPSDVLGRASRPQPRPAWRVRRRPLHGARPGRARIRRAARSVISGA